MPGRARTGAAIVLAAAFLASAPAEATVRTLKLWPFFEYATDAETHTVALKILGPLIEYRRDPDYVRIAVRPVLSVRQARQGHDDEVRLLYPLFVSRWGADEQRTTGLGGVVDYRTRTEGTDGAEHQLTAQRFRILPVYFYAWDPARGSAASLVPVYADLEDVLGFERVQMVLFPSYLRVRQPLVERRWVLFPFFGDVGGPQGGGFSVWPFYGRTTVGDRYDGGFTLWPFYVWETRTGAGESEQRLVSFPFYASVRGPERESTAYGPFLYTHTIDRAAPGEAWGFPWPLGVYERSTAGDGAMTFRVFPFYERRRGELDARIGPWPLSPERGAGDDRPARGRSEALLVLRGDVANAGGTGRLRTLFPAFRDRRQDDEAEIAAPALLDAFFPSSSAIREDYAPLWQLYTRAGPSDDRRWSVGWGAVTHTRAATLYPWHWETATP